MVFDELTGDMNVECTILLHGFGNIGKNMEYLAKGIMENGMNTITPTLPTTACSVSTCAVLLNDNIRDEIGKYKKIHFVGHSMGGLIIRKYLLEYMPKNIGRCVFIATPHLGSELADIAGNIPFVTDLLKSVKDLMKSENNEYILNNIDIGLIIGKKTGGIGKIVFDNQNDGLVEIESALSIDAKEVYIVDYTHHEICHRIQTVNLVKNFIKNGNFTDCPDEQYSVKEKNMDVDLLKQGLKLLSLGEILPSMPNIPFPTMGGQFFWNELANVNGWRVQQNMLTQHCRVLDPDDMRIAWGGADAIMKAFERLLKK